MEYSPAPEAKKYRFATFGCKANWTDSQELEATLIDQGWVAAESGDRNEDVALCIVNSCTVTDEADRQSRKEVQRLLKSNPNAQVIFTGCGAEVNPSLNSTSTKDAARSFILGNQDKARWDSIIHSLSTTNTNQDLSRGATLLGGVTSYSELLSQHPMDREWPDISQPRVVRSAHQTKRTRAFVKIQEGCNSFCTYCIIPYGRGPSRSLEIPSVVDHIRHLVDSGISEVILTGTNIGDYGKEMADFTRLLKSILQQTSLKRLRLSSLDPVEITPELLELMRSDSRLCAHFHVSLQSPVSPILRLMKRKYRTQQVIECLRKIEDLGHARGGVFIGMDVITGFPGETEELFQEGLNLLKSLPWSRLHVFPFSERDGTPATRLPGSVPRGERLHRAQTLRQISLERMEVEARRAHQRASSPSIGTKQFDSILWEPLQRGPDGTGLWLSGYTPQYWRVLQRVGSVEEKRQRINTISSAQLDAEISRVLIKDLGNGEISFLAKPSEALLGLSD